jgi:hypothetical protein
MSTILGLQRLQAEAEEVAGNSDTSITCQGNSCISWNCGSTKI